MPETALTRVADEVWLGLIIGNTRLHWALFQGRSLSTVWHTPHCRPQEAESLIQQQFSPAGWRSLAALSTPKIEIPSKLVAITSLQHPPALYCGSVVPEQTALWQTYGNFHEVRLADLPLTNLYPTLGIDRALNLLGAGDRYGSPILVIDAGTALTFTAGKSGRLVGGAILPGLSTQLAALQHHTAALPAIALGTQLPPRWSTNTSDAIRSGVIYGALATLQDFIQTWQHQYPDGKAVLTGGDSARLFEWMQRSHPGAQLYQDANLTFWGLCRYREHEWAKRR